MKEMLELYVPDIYSNIELIAELMWSQYYVLEDILYELQRFRDNAQNPTDINPIIEMLQLILDALEELKINITQIIEGQPERLTWWQRIVDMLLTVLEGNIYLLVNIIEWIAGLLMWIIEEIIMAIVRGIIDITSGMIGWLARNLGAFFELFNSDSPVTRWYRDEEDWWNYLPNSEIYIMYIPYKGAIKV